MTVHSNTFPSLVEALDGLHGLPQQWFTVSPRYSVFTRGAAGVQFEPVESLGGQKLLIVSSRRLSSSELELLLRALERGLSLESERAMLVEHYNPDELRRSESTAILALGGNIPQEVLPQAIYNAPELQQALQQPNQKRILWESLQQWAKLHDSQTT